jgi:hypothetical protein
VKLGASVTSKFNCTPGVHFTIILHLESKYSERLLPYIKIMNTIFFLPSEYENSELISIIGPPLWSSGQSSWL